ncbi:MAG: hypothetical protein OK454_11745, partial [Thaumarchaeota archaeon]|nr:hypothetical protein [Nitrososphaerota archaeon]
MMHILTAAPRRHGKFRPTLMKLVSSNDPSLVQETIQQAIRAYRSAPPSSSSSSRASAALEILTRLKGIGPATASLLLAVHFPAEAPFFADEAMLWLCCGGKKDTVIKYNAKEYAQLCEQAGKLMDLVIIRVLFVLVLTAACYFLQPFALQPWTAAPLGAAAAAAVIIFELRVRALSIKRLLGAVLGSVLGIAGAALFGMVLGGSLPPGGTRALLQLFVLMLMSYIGLMVG